MKKWTIALLIAAMVLCLAACGGSSDTAVDVDMSGLAAELMNSGAFTDLLSQTAENVPAKLYGFEDGDVTECVMYYGTGATAEEIFLAKASDSAAAARLAEACQSRVSNQKASFENYVPEEIPKLDSAVLKTVGNYVIFVVSNDSSAVQTIVDDYTT